MDIKKESYFNVDISKLTLAGWSLAAASIAVAMGAMFAGFWISHAISARAKSGGWLSLVLLAVGFVVTFVAGRFVLQAAGVPILKTEKSEEPNQKPPL